MLLQVQGRHLVARLHGRRVRKVVQIVHVRTDQYQIVHVRLHRVEADLIVRALRAREFPNRQLIAAAVQSLHEHQWDARRTQRVFVHELLNH